MVPTDSLRFPRFWPRGSPAGIQAADWRLVRCIFPSKNNKSAYQIALINYFDDYKSGVNKTTITCELIITLS